MTRQPPHPPHLLLSQVPNLLTLLRIAACPVLVLLLRGDEYDLALLLFLAAGITDGLDGYIAKRYNCVSGLGAILDPIADKLLIASAYIMLAILAQIPFWLLIVVMFRDLVIVVGYLILAVMGEDIPMKPTYTSKFNTFLQIALVVVVLGGEARWLAGLFGIDELIQALVFGVLITTIVSGSQYVWAWGIRGDSSDSSKS